MAADWPDLLEIVEKRVRPEREKGGGKLSPDQAKRTEKWWQFARNAKDLHVAIEGQPRAFACSQVSPNFAIAAQPIDRVMACTLVVFAQPSFAAIAGIQSRAHEVWVRFFASSMKDDLRYTPSDCFETFPFSTGFETNAVLEAARREYYEFRAVLMVRNNEGLTKTYNRFHDPEVFSPDIIKLRELHAKMDATVLTAYGWTDLLPKCACEFLLDYEEEDETEDEGKSRKRKKPWRYRWPDEIRDEVLARLLKLNAERAEQEKLSGDAAAAVQPMKTHVKESSAAPVQGEIIPSAQKDLFA